MDKLLVLKLGGSLLTDKRIPYSLRNDVIIPVCREVKDCLDGGLVSKLVVVHGVGSYGHPPVIEHKLHKGYIDPRQLLPLSRTQTKVNELRAVLTTCMQEVGLPVNLFHPSSIALAQGGKIVSMHLEAVKGFLDVGMVPVLGGDMVFDSSMGFSVGSGDQVATYLARELGATDLIFATDVAGVYETDPKIDPNAALIRELSVSSLKEVSGVSSIIDASGAMRGKLSNLLALEEQLRSGLRASIISMMEPGRLSGWLRGEKIGGTTLLP